MKYILVPNFSEFSIMTVVSAMGQMFYSLSIAMGILITFGSYMKKEVSIMIRFLCPVFVIIILLSSIASVFGLIQV